MVIQTDLGLTAPLGQAQPPVGSKIEVDKKGSKGWKRRARSGAQESDHDVPRVESCHGKSFAADGSLSSDEGLKKRQCKGIGISVVHAATQVTNDPPDSLLLAAAVSQPRRSP